MTFHARTSVAGRGIPVAAVLRCSPAWQAGIRRGDRVLRVDGDAVHDELEFAFLTARPAFSVEIVRDGRARTFDIARGHGEYVGVELWPPPVRRCANRCVFCFVDQMPAGLRSSLYVKDEDVRHSFLNGNYVTLAAARREELDRIIRLGLSPLYVSVHATDLAVRRALLGNARAPDIVEQLRYLVKGGIVVHAQIVVCPGHNDGMELRRTLRELLRLGAWIASVAVVPVGLTRFRRIPLRPVDAAAARAICRDVATIGDADARRTGGRRVFAADELFIRAGLPIPPRRWYGDFAQIENGVGLVRRMIDEWSSLSRAVTRRPSRKAWVVTGVSAGPYLAPIVEKMAGRHVRMVVVRNRFFGETVTVAGLLTARDVVAAVRSQRPGRTDRIILPAVMFNHRGVTLDGWTMPRLGRALGRRTAAAGTVTELAAALGNPLAADSRAAKVHR